MAHRLSRQEADYLVALPKQIHDPIRWKTLMGGADRHDLSARVESAQLDKPMQLVGSVGNKNWSFILLTQANVPVRKLTVHGPCHRNPDGTDAGTHHKHTWDETHEDRKTYYPEDIDFSDINAALAGFLDECNIKASHPPERLTLERRLR